MGEKYIKEQDAASRQETGAAFPAKKYCSMVFPVCKRGKEKGRGCFLFPQLQKRKDRKDTRFLIAKTRKGDEIKFLQFANGDG